MTINIGDTIYVLAKAGTISKGVFSGEKSKGFFGITIDDKVYFYRMSEYFRDEETAEARRFVRRYKRMAKMGHPIENIVSETDKKSIEIATRLWPEDMV